MFSFKHVSLAVLWKDSKTYPGNLGKFRLAKMSIDVIFCWQDWAARHPGKNCIKWESGEFYARVMADLPRILFGHAYARLALKKWLKHGQQKT